MTQKHKSAVKPIKLTTPVAPFLWGDVADGIENNQNANDDDLYYHAMVKVDAAEFAQIKRTIDKMVAEVEVEAQALFETRNEGNAPYKTAVDRDTGEKEDAFIFSAKSKAFIEAKGKRIKLPMRDVYGRPISQSDVDLGPGAQIKLAIQLIPYLITKGSFGVSAKLLAVQVISEGGASIEGMFGNESGDDDFEESVESQTSVAGDANEDRSGDF